MKLQLIAAAALAAALSVTGLAVAEDDDRMAECKAYAEEDGVPADEMDDYLAQCMEDKAASESEDAKDEQEEEPADEESSDEESKE